MEHDPFSNELIDPQNFDVSIYEPFTTEFEADGLVRFRTLSYSDATEFEGLLDFIGFSADYIGPIAVEKFTDNLRAIVRKMYD